MKIFRGPKSKSHWDITHTLVSTVSSEELEESIRDGTYIQFNVTKDGYERQAVCTAQFENKDIIPMINGLMSKLKSQQLALLKISEVIKNQELSESKQLRKIKNIVNKLQSVG